MLEQTLVNATDLIQWSIRRDASARLPQLLRRLITTSVDEIVRIQFRSDEGISVGGYDGEVEVIEGNAFVPKGKSVWEFGTNKDVKGKADDDYDKRRADSLGRAPSETTYVFVTPRRWGGKDEWVSNRQAEGFWKEVRAYDADDLEAWLELAPPTHIWFSILLGKRPEGAIDINNFWLEWSGVTNPPLSPRLITSGRDEAIEQIVSWLRSGPSTFALQASSREEAISFFAGVLESLQNEERDLHSARCVVVESLAAWRRLIASESPLILVPNFVERESISNVSHKGHHVCIPLGNGDSKSPNTLVIASPNREQAKQALLEMGVSSDRADSLASLARRSMLALRRNLALSPEVQRPAWAAPNEARSLLPILLTGKWKESVSADRDVLARLARTSYEEINHVLSRWANESDTIVSCTGDIWLLISIEDAWSLLSRFFTREDLETFESVVLDVLSAEDPALELSVNDRWKANLFGKSLPNSGFLRSGIAETLALMAARGDTINWLDTATAQERVNRIVGKLLDKANQNWRIWASISHLLPLLAEAAPTVFLDAVDLGLSGDHPLLLNLFDEGEQSLFGGSSSHTGLLWALEVLAWHPNYLSHSALILAKLARLDPGGKLANRPDKSLREIFLGWLPQTIAKLEQRLQVIDTVRRREPHVAWKLMLTLLPEDHSVAHLTAQPRWREWGTDSPQKPTYAEVWQLAREIVHRLIEDVGVTKEKWCGLLKAIVRVPKEQQDAIISKANELDLASFAPDDRIEIWKTLRGIISKHREFADADWAMSADLVNQLEEIYEHFTPEDPVDRYSWLFSYKVNPPNPSVRKTDDWQVRGQAIDGMRHNAILELFSQNGLSLCVQLVEKSEIPEIVGYVMGEADLLKNDENHFLSKYLAEPSVIFQKFAIAFVSGRFQHRGWEWVQDKLAENILATWSSEQKASFFIGLPFDEKTWNLLEVVGGNEVEKSYWSRVMPRYANGIDYERVVKRLIQYHRSPFAVDYLGLFIYGENISVSPHLAAETLEQLLLDTAELQITWGDIGHDIAMLMSLVRNSGEIAEDQIARLEWNLLPILENFGGGPKTLQREVSRNPDFFVELIKLVFKSETEDSSTSVDEVEGIRTRYAYSLLHSLHTCPGSSEDGSLDQNRLREWVTHARGELHKSGREAIGDSQIGQALAESPFGIDGAFPHEFVRDLIEDLANAAIERGFEARVYNNRGITWRGPTDGGAQERGIAERYQGYAAQMVDRFPRTAAMLRRIADTYVQQARDEDVSAKLTEDLWS